MSIISRFKDIMDANVNSVLSRAEEKNADKLLEKYLRDAKENLARVKSETAGVIANEKAAERELSECETNIAKYVKYASAAVKAGNDDDARKFLSAKAELSGKLELLKSNYENAKADSLKMRDMTQKLSDDINAAQKKMNELNAKSAIAKQREKQAELMEKLDSDSGIGNMNNLFDAVQKRIDKAEAMVELNSDKDADDLSELEKKYGAYNISDADSAPDSPKASSVDDELEKLKNELGV
ncbi:MAG: PspA/IM30 family protein [Oscillospiraceae bacterium]|nr:PspA/IM30 family protein [Oscillospiraceae bacterium]